MSTKHPSAGMLWLIMALSVVVGAPLVAFLWETLNELLALHVNLLRLLISLPVLLLFAGMLWLLGRTIRRWTMIEHAE